MTRTSLTNAVMVLIGISLIAVGTLAVVAPATAAAMFGVPTSATQTRAYVWSTGTRDIVIGIWLIALVVLRVGPRLLGASLLVTGLIPLGDVFIVYINSGTRSAVPLVFHSAAIVLFFAFGLWLWQDRKRS